MSDLLDDAPSRPNPSPLGPSDFILPSRFFLPGSERIETHPSRSDQDSGVSLIPNIMQSGRREYHGSTSVYQLVEFVLEYRDGARCEPMPFEDRFPNRRPEFWEVQDVSLLLAPCDGALTSHSGWNLSRVPLPVVYNSHRRTSSFPWSVVTSFTRTSIIQCYTAQRSSDRSTKGFINAIASLAAFYLWCVQSEHASPTTPTFLISLLRARITV